MLDKLHVDEFNHLGSWLHPQDPEKPPRGHRFLQLADAVWSWRKSIVAVIAMVAAAWTLGPRLLYGPVVEAQPVIKADFVQSVVASGHVEAPFRVSVASQITGVVSDVPVSEGQTVKAGDVLVVLDDTEARALVVQAEGAVAQTEARMRQLRELSLPSAQENLKQVRATLLNAQQAYDRAKHLAETGAGTRVALDDATKALDVVRAQVRAAEFQVYTNSPGGSDYVMAETQLRQAAAALATARSRLGYTVIKAPRDGVLIARNVERGNVVQPSMALMVLSPFEDTQVVVQVDEKNLGLVAVGQNALVSADAYPSKSFPAEVFYINPGVDLQRASVEVKLKVPNPPDYLRQDMTVSIDIETARRPGALILPSNLIRGISSERPWVMKVEAGRATHQPVQIGLITIGKVQIAGGLQEGDLAIPPSSDVKEGQRVRARAASGKTP